MLKSGAPFIVTFSNRMFPTKAVAIWANASEQQRVDLVIYYFTQSAAFEKIEIIDRSSGCHRSAVGRARLSQGNDKELN